MAIGLQASFQNELLRGLLMKLCITLLEFDFLAYLSNAGYNAEQEQLEKF